MLFRIVFTTIMTGIGWTSIKKIFNNRKLNQKITLFVSEYSQTIFIILFIIGWNAVQAQRSLDVKAMC